jgi:transposase
MSEHLPSYDDCWKPSASCSASARFTAAVHDGDRRLRGDVTPAQLAGQRDAFDDCPLAGPGRAVSAYARPSRHLWRHCEQWFTFLTDPAVEATNWPAERAPRPAAVNRKVWGGIRTEARAQSQGVLTSVLRTCRRQTRSALDSLGHTPRPAGDLFLPRPVLLPAR